MGLAMEVATVLVQHMRQLQSPDGLSSQSDSEAATVASQGQRTLDEPTVIDQCAGGIDLASILGEAGELTKRSEIICVWRSRFIIITQPSVVNDLFCTY